ncbi:MAG: VWA domain-containing protein [Alphaproteobacteria bacterium]|nr:VWA domain-containing protein [Alphaproteobacteria bacterium]
MLAWVLLLTGCGECDPDLAECVLERVDLPVDPYTPPREDHTVTERLAVEAPQVDVLFVIDNSDATSTAQLDRVAAGVPELYAALDAHGADYHIGVVTSELGRRQGVLLGYTDSRERITSLFREAAPAGADAGYGRLTAHRALVTEADGANLGFQRADAELHVVFVSGQDDLSVNPDPIEFTSFVRLARERGGYAHVVVPADAAVYAGYADRTGGQVADIDEGDLDYGAFLGELRPPRMYLDHVPADPASMRVRFERDSERPLGRQRPGPVCIGAPDPETRCLLLYHPETNALEWRVPPDRDITAVWLDYDTDDSRY